MGLMLADHDLDVEPDNLLEDLESCRCEHASFDHGPAGCRAGECLCAATWDGLAAEDLEKADELEADAVRVTAALRAARARRKVQEDERQERAAKDPASAPRSRSRRLKPMPKMSSSHK